MGCSCKNCDCKKEVKSKKVKAYFCPNCKSTNVRFVFELKNLFGIVPKMRCLDCKTELPSFPIISTTEEKKKKAITQKPVTRKKSTHSPKPTAHSSKKSPTKKTTHSSRPATRSQKK